MSQHSPQNDPVLTLLENINARVEENSQRLTEMEVRHAEAVPTDGVAQDIDAIARLMENPITAVIIGIAVLSIGIPFLKKFVDNNFNHFGKDKAGKKITHAQIQRKQLEYQKKNYAILKKLAEKEGFKIKEREDEIFV